MQLSFTGHSRRMTSVCFLIFQKGWAGLHMPESWPRRGADIPRSGSWHAGLLSSAQEAPQAEPVCPLTEGASPPLTPWASCPQNSHQWVTMQFPWGRCFSQPVPREHQRNLLSPRENAAQSRTSAAFPSTKLAPILPSAMATEERNSTPRNAKTQPKTQANRAGGQQGRVSMRYVTACCVLLNSKHLATEEPSPTR